MFQSYQVGKNTHKSLHMEEEHPEHAMARLVKPEEVDKRVLN